MNKFKKFDEFIKKSLKNCWNFPSLGIIMFDSNDILYKHISGYSDLKKKQKLSIKKKFCIASCTKSILCLAISSLIKKNKIPNIWEMTLDQVWSKNIHKDFKKVKVKQLASHNSGIDSPVDNPQSSNCVKQYSKIENKLSNLNGIDARKQLTNIILKQKSLYKPGSKFVYSNWGYGILGAIIEKLTNKHYSKIIDEEIMKPLKIDADYEKLFYGKDYVNGHYNVWWDKNLKDKLIPIKKNQHINPLLESPSGETWMSILDCAKYCQEYLKAFNNEITTINKSVLINNTKLIFEDYSYGWSINKRKHIYHGGSYFHTSSHFHLLPDKNIGIVLFTNTDIPASIKWSIIGELIEII